MLGKLTIAVEYSINSEKAVYKITDAGNGFDHQTMLNIDIDLENSLMRYHGRGIFISKSIFDEVIYNEKGNEVKLIKRFV